MEGYHLHTKFAHPPRTCCLAMCNLGEVDLVVLMRRNTVGEEAKVGGVEPRSQRHDLSAPITRAA